VLSTDVGMNVCLSSSFVQIATVLLLQFFSDSHETWHNLCAFVPMCKKLWRFPKFCFTSFWRIFQILHWDFYSLEQLKYFSEPELISQMTYQTFRSKMTANSSHCIYNVYLKTYLICIGTQHVRNINK